MSANHGPPSLVNPSEFIFGAADPKLITFYVQILYINHADE